MSFLKALKGAISFLTIAPVGGVLGELQEIALHTYLFPVIGAGIGFCAGLLGNILMTFLPTPMMAAVLTAGALYLVTGLNHFDGLVDFGDGLMLSASPEEKVEAMRDKNTGAGGLGLGILNTLLLVSCLGATQPGNMLTLMIVSETSAKFAMVLGAGLGKPSPEGIGAIFIRTLKTGRGRISLLVATLLSVGISVFTLGAKGLLGVASAVVIGGAIVIVSHRNFRCVTGDVLGAINELARSFLILMLVVLNWL